MHLGDVDDTAYGLKTFFKWPVVSDITGIAENDPYAGHSDSTLVPVAAVKRALLDQVAALQDAIIPVGFLYVQYPGFGAPTALWPWATWSSTETASAFAGAFFRAEGTGALAFGGGLQEQQLLSHKHDIVYGNSDANSITDAKADAGTVPFDDWFADDHVLYDLPTSTSIFPDAASIENRPKNFTIRIWKRTA